MWTEENVSTVIREVRQNVDVLVEGVCPDETSNSCIQSSNDCIEDFCYLDVIENRLDSPCFRLGAGDLKLHNADQWDVSADGRGCVRARRLANQIHCYAICCGADLRHGCVRCDRLPNATEKEEHFIRMDIREPIEVPGYRNLLKLLLLSRMGRRLYKDYASQDMHHHTTIPLDLCQDLQLLIATQSVRDKIKYFQKMCDVLCEKKMEEIEAKNLTKTSLGSLKRCAETCLHKRKRIHTISMASATGTDLNLLEAIRQNSGADFPTFYTHDADRAHIQSEINNLKQENFDAMKELINERTRESTKLKALSDAYEMTAAAKKDAQEALSEVCAAFGVGDLFHCGRIALQIAPSSDTNAIVSFFVSSYDKFTK